VQWGLSVIFTARLFACNKYEIIENLTVINIYVSHFHNFSNHLPDRQSLRNKVVDIEIAFYQNKKKTIAQPV
jgi:hypothetical protein